MEKATGQGWSLRRCRERLLRAVARVVKQTRWLTFMVAWSEPEDWWERLSCNLQGYR